MHDVFLFIDPNESDNKCEGLLHDKTPVSNYSEANMIKLKQILIEDRIKVIKYTNDMSQDEINYDTKQSNEMVDLWNKFNLKYGNINVVDFLGNPGIKLNAQTVYNDISGTLNNIVEIDISSSSPIYKFVTKRSHLENNSFIVCSWISKNNTNIYYLFLFFLALLTIFFYILLLNE